MNLPTQLTFLRILLIPVFVTLFFVPFPYHCFVATGVFVIASFTDFLDGYLARKNNLVTDLGKFLDPIADKMLVSCALFAVVLYENTFQVGVVVCAMIIMCRELMVSMFRTVASTKNIVLAADKLGKIKTILQMCALILLLPISDVYACLPSGADLSFDVTVIGDSVLYCGLILLVLSTVMAVISAINYIVKNKHVFKD